MRIGILTSGGDCPGINATIRGVCKTAINHYGMEVIGIHSGFQGLLTKDVESFTEKSLYGLEERRDVRRGQTGTDSAEYRRDGA